MKFQTSLCVTLLLIVGIHATSHASMGILASSNAGLQLARGSLMRDTTLQAAGISGAVNVVAGSVSSDAEIIKDATVAEVTAAACIADESSAIINAIARNTAQAVSATAVRAATRITAIIEQLIGSVLATASAGGITSTMELKGLIAGLVGIIEGTTIEAETIINLGSATVENAINNAARLSVMVARAETAGTQLASSAATAVSKHIAQSLAAGVSGLTHSA